MTHNPDLFVYIFGKGAVRLNLIKYIRETKNHNWGIKIGLQDGQELLFEYDSKEALAKALDMIMLQLGKEYFPHENNP